MLSYLLQRNHPRHISGHAIQVVRDLVLDLRREQNDELADELVAFVLLEPRLWVYRPFEEQAEYVHNLRDLMYTGDGSVTQVRPASGVGARRAQRLTFCLGDGGVTADGSRRSWQARTCT